MKLKGLKGKTGITLVALVITIIVLVILAGVSINLVLGDNGIIQKAKEGKNNYTLAEEQEKKDLEDMYSSIMVATNDDSKITISMQDLNTLIENKVKEQLNNSNTSSVPAGTVISYITGTSAPEGYLKCDGTVYNISEYQTLADSIKNGLGSYNYYGGDGTTTFAVPNLQGEFLRGTGANSNTTQGNGTSVGKHQDSTTIPAYFQYEGNKVSFRYDDGALGPNSDYAIKNYDGLRNSIGIVKGININGTEGSSGMTGASYNVRPTNTSVLYCIKY